MAATFLVIGLAGCARQVEYRAAESLPDVQARNGEDVMVADVGTDGMVRGPSKVPKVILSEDGWRNRLSPLGFAVLRTKATELAFTGRYDKYHETGVYRCAGCGAALFLSAAKFDSGTGWPSFTAPVAQANVYTQVDASFGQARDEVLCRRCDGHLGHVFPDGPEPTGLRYCLNSAALRFERQAAPNARPVAAADGVRQSR